MSLVDGKDLVPDKGLGSAATPGATSWCHETRSRGAAELAVTEDGYVVRDTSSNGVYVNGERIQGSHRSRPRGRDPGGG